MKAVIIPAAGASPVFGEFREPSAIEGKVIVNVHASALSQLSKMRSSGAHYSSEGVFPSVPGVDGTGITQDGRRVYFALPETPFGALAEQSLVEEKLCIPLPDNLDDITAAAMANPGMSAWAALVERAKFVRGETVLINGATGSAGSMAVQVAKYLGAGRILVSGRNAEKLEALRKLGADEVIPFTIDADHPDGADTFQQALKPHFGSGIDVVLDYLWGGSARAIIAAIARYSAEAHRVRFVQIGSASGENSIDLPSAALRSSAIELMGSGLKSVPMNKLMEGIAHIFEGAAQGAFQIALATLPLEKIAEAWQAPGEPRMVVTIP
ncbi:zinc-binding alcohol dehydrogenase family protein [Terriglobus sp. RCC_193]|uniref:quinone oxidoreductase family protein n=1 Tax=Terriglobus sp. RCC_193 TaxID=3239218 RepID=UPI0035236EA9